MERHPIPFNEAAYQDFIRDRCANFQAVLTRLDRAGCLGASAMTETTALLTRPFRDDERGGVAIIFALMLLPILTIVSLAIDYGRALKVNSELSSAADAATAAALHKLPATVTDLRPFIRIQLDANLPKHLKNLPFDFNISEQRRVIELSVTARVATAVIGLVGIDHIDVNVVSTQIIPKAPALLPQLPARGPSNVHDAEEAMRRALNGLANHSGPGSSSHVEAPSADEIAKATEEVNRQVREALDSIGKGDVDFDALKQALGNR